LFSDPYENLCENFLKSLQFELAISLKKW